MNLFLEDRQGNVMGAEKRTGGQLLVSCLKNLGVETRFGVAVESYLAVLDALYDVDI